MKKIEFLEKVKETLEIPEENIDFDTFLTIDSMGILGLIALFDENFNIKVKAIDLKGKHTVENLIELLGQNKLE